MSKWRQVKRIQARRINARNRANRRWRLDRERRAKLDLLDPVRVGGRIVRRIVVIDEESRVTERTFYEFDRPCDWRRKLRALLTIKLSRLPESVNL